MKPDGRVDQATLFARIKEQDRLEAEMKDCQKIKDDKRSAGKTE